MWWNDCCVGQVSELRGEVSRLEAEKEELEKELDTQTNHTHKQVSNPGLSVSTQLWVCGEETDAVCAGFHTLTCLCVIFRYRCSSLRSRPQRPSSRTCRNPLVSHRMQSRVGWWVMSVLLCVCVPGFGVAHPYKIIVCCIISSYIFKKYLSLSHLGAKTQLSVWSLMCIWVTTLINIILGGVWHFHLCVQAELSFSQRKMCSELSRLKGDEVEEEPDSSLSIPATLQVRLLL